MNSIIFSVSHRLLYCVFTEVDFEKKGKATNSHISSKVKISIQSSSMPTLMDIATVGGGGRQSPALRFRAHH